MRSIRRQILFIAVAVLLAAASIELLLRLAAIGSPTVARLLASPWVAYTVSDPELVVRPNPLHPEHDARGWRNPAALDRASIVALGDSQTYGTRVLPAQAWPRRLEAILGEPVYALAFGGYGPVHADVLFDEAIALEPDVVILGFYLGNDLFDAFSLVYEHGQRPELKTTDAALEARLQAAERVEPLVDRIVRVAHAGAEAGPEGDAPEADHGPAHRVAEIVKQARVYGLFRRLRFEAAGRLSNALLDPAAAWEAAKADAAAHPAFCQVFEDASARTVFTSEYRQTALDLEDERIAEGLEISLRAFEHMDARARAAGVRFLVMVIPTKETVFAQRWNTPTPAFQRLVASEAIVMERVRTHLRRHAIELIEVLPVLRAELDRGRQPYPVDRDGHPNPAGHQAIAEAVAERWKHPL